MSGTKAGGAKTAAANKANDPDFYVKIGRKGGSVNRPETRPFANRELASKAGYKGGIVTGDQYKTRRKDATV